jgi:hypothetical protein
VPGEASMRPSVVLAAEEWPGGSVASCWSGIGLCAGPFTQEGLNEALGLAAKDLFRFVGTKARKGSTCPIPS